MTELRNLENDKIPQNAFIAEAPAGKNLQRSGRTENRKE